MDDMTFDCCDKPIAGGGNVYNVGDSIDVILYCSEHHPARNHKTTIDPGYNPQHADIYFGFGS